MFFKCITTMFTCHVHVVEYTNSVPPCFSEKNDKGHHTVGSLVLELLKELSVGCKTVEQEGLFVPQPMSETPTSTFIIFFSRNSKFHESGIYCNTCSWGY